MEDDYKRVLEMLKRSMALNVTPGVWRNVVSSAGGTPFAEVKNDEGATVAVFGNIHFPHCRDNAQFFASARRDLVPDAIRVIEELLAEREVLNAELRALGRGVGLDGDYKWVGFDLEGGSRDGEE